jgi:hypothetical protein
MKFAVLTAALAAAVVASPVANLLPLPLPLPPLPGLPKPAPSPAPTGPQSIFKATPIIGCLNQAQANTIINAFIWLLANPKATNFNATADALMSNTFTDTSDSINFMAGIPVSPNHSELYVVQS